MNNKNDKVVYLHRKKSNGVAFYVGAGNPDRPYSKGSRSSEWKDIYNNQGVEVVIIKTGLSTEDACSTEMELIELIGRIDLGTGTLINRKKGGEGLTEWTDEMKARASDNYTQERKEKMSETHRKDVIDISTGIEYKSMGDACKALGFTYSTITTQLRGAAPIRKWNTLRYKDAPAPTRDMFYSAKDNEIKHGMVIDTNTNKIYKSIRLACEELNLSYGSNRGVLCGSRKRQDNHTLYRLGDLQIISTGYIAS